MKKFDIYIGLKDQDTLSEVLTPEQFAEILSKQCQNRNIGFSMMTQLGGYGHKKGYVIETSLRITLLGLEENEVKSLAETLRQKVNTDTVLISSEECEYYYR